MSCIFTGMWYYTNTSPLHTTTITPSTPSHAPASTTKRSSHHKQQTCPLCFKTLSVWSMSRHFKDKHSNITTKFECRLCARRYKTKNSLNNHMSKYHREHLSARRTSTQPPAPKNVNDLGSDYLLTGQLTGFASLLDSCDFGGEVELSD